MVQPSISSGLNHAIYLSSEGKLYGIGNNFYSQLALPQLIIYNDWVHIPFPERIVKAVAASQGLFIVTESNRLYATGLNNAGQLGIPPRKDKVVHDFTLVPFNLPIYKIVANIRATIIIDEDGQVYATG